MWTQFVTRNEEMTEGNNILQWIGREVTRPGVAMILGFSFLCTHSMMTGQSEDGWQGRIAMSILMRRKSFVLVRYRTASITTVLNAAGNSIGYRRGVGMCSAVTVMTTFR